jgi:cystathionine beta-lyase
MKPIEADSLAQLRKRKSAKWRAFPADVLPLPVAEMDFQISDSIKKVLHDLVDRSDLGYLASVPELPEAFASFAKRRWNWILEPEHVHLGTDVGVVIVEILRLLGKPGDRVVITTPVYPAFAYWIKEVHMEADERPLIEENGNWRLDFAAIEKAFASGSKFFLMSSPHNPLGLIYEKEDLSKLAELAKAYNVIIISDEIHAPLTFTSGKFVPFLTVSDTAREVGITVTSASKSWNLAGLKCGFFYTQSEKLREALAPLAMGIHHRASITGAFGMVAAFNDSDAWLDSVIARLELNKKFLDELVSGTPLKVSNPHNSYLSWIDFRATDLGEDPAAVILERAKIAVNSGLAFGEPGKGFVRLNFGTSPEILQNAFSGIKSLL